MSTTTRKPIALAAGGTTLALAAAATAAMATAPAGLVTTPLARGKLVKPINANIKVAGGQVNIQTKGALDVLMLHVTLAPGATSGWDKLAGPVLSVVKQGTLTVVDGKCMRHDIPAGGANFAPGTLRELENRGTTTVDLNVTFLIPHGVKKPDIDARAPAGCTA